MAAWLTVVGMGDDGWSGLSPTAQTLISGADHVVGGQRHLDLLPPMAAQTHLWPSPFADAQPLLESLRGQAVVVLASGDPQWFGVGVSLFRWFPADQIIILPHAGAFSLAAARLGWAIQDCLCLTVHGRPLESLHLHLAPGRKLLVLAEDGQSPAAVARLLEKAGYGPSSLTVLWHLGGKAEGQKSATAEEWVGATPDLNVMAIQCRAEPRLRALSLVGGLPDEAFQHDGQLTKREIRAVTLSSLVPVAGELLWDVGAGCGSIAIEWARAGGLATAIESNPERCRMIAANGAKLGVPGIRVIQGKAPDSLPYTDPQAIFVGGGVSVPGLLEACWSALAPGGRLVVNAVTMEGEAALALFHQRRGGQMIRLAVSRLAPVGIYHTWHPAMPVTHYVGRKV
jgi:precorrin-6B C5,15-methyltransferase / cobalt-precorrin-6B C5,C15-methyltransferase